MNADDTLEWKRRSFLLRPSEVDGVIAELRRIAREWGLEALGEQLSGQLDAARVRAESRPYGRKGFRFWPTPVFAELLARAVAAARGHERAAGQPRRARIERRFCAIARA